MCLTVTLVAAQRDRDATKLAGHAQRVTVPNR